MMFPHVNGAVLGSEPLRAGQPTGNRMDVPVTFRRRLRYWFDNTMSKGTPALVGWLAFASMLVVVIGGLLVWLLDPVPEDGKQRGLLDSMWQSVLHALDPGTVAGDSGHWW